MASSLSRASLMVARVSALTSPIPGNWSIMEVTKASLSVGSKGSLSTVTTPSLDVSEGNSSSLMRRTESNDLCGIVTVNPSTATMQARAAAPATTTEERRVMICLSLCFWLCVCTTLKKKKLYSCPFRAATSLAKKKWPAQREVFASQPSVSDQS